jgi:hypothetical protein
VLCCVVLCCVVFRGVITTSRLLSAQTSAGTLVRPPPVLLVGLAFFYAVRVVSKESKRPILPRTPYILDGQAINSHKETSFNLTLAHPSWKPLRANDCFLWAVGAKICTLHCQRKILSWIADRGTSTATRSRWLQLAPPMSSSLGLRFFEKTPFYWPVSSASLSNSSSSSSSSHVMHPYQEIYYRSTPSRSSPELQRDFVVYPRQQKRRKPKTWALPRKERTHPKALAARTLQLPSTFAPETAEPLRLAPARPVIERQPTTQHPRQESPSQTHFTCYFAHFILIDSLLTAVKGPLTAFPQWNLTGAPQGLECFSSYNSRRVVGLFTGHFRLKGHIFKLGLTDDPICERWLEEDESATHILYNCEAIAYLRFRHLGQFFMEPSNYCDAPLNKVLHFIRGVGLIKG